MTDPRDEDPVNRSTPPERDLSRRSEGGPMLLLVIGVFVLIVVAAYVAFAL